MATPARFAIFPTSAALIALEIQPAQSSEASAAFQRGESLYNAAQYKAALVELDRAVQRSPDFASAWRLRGKALVQLQNYDEARISISKAIGYAPRDPDNWATQGDFYQAQRDYESAVKSYEEALRFMPRDRRSDRVELARSRSFAIFEVGYRAATEGDQDIMRQQYSAAVLAYDDALLEAQGGDEEQLSRIYLERGEVLRRLKLYSEALASFEQTVQRNPNLAEGWFRSGLILAELKQWQAALASYDKATTLDPAYAEAWDNRGWSLYNQGKYGEAIQSFKRATQGKVRNQWGGEKHLDRTKLLYGIADSLFLLKCYRKAVPVFQEVMDLDPSPKNPSFKKAQKRFRELQLLLKQPSPSSCQAY